MVWIGGGWNPSSFEVTWEGTPYIRPNRQLGQGETLVRWTITEHQDVHSWDPLGFAHVSTSQRFCLKWSAHVALGICSLFFFFSFSGFHSYPVVAVGVLSSGKSLRETKKGADETVSGTREWGFPAFDPKSGSPLGFPSKNSIFHSLMAFCKRPMKQPLLFFSCFLKGPIFDQAVLAFETEARK